MLKQLEWGLQNGPITKSGVLPVPKCPHSYFS